MCEHEHVRRSSFSIQARLAAGMGLGRASTRTPASRNHILERHNCKYNVCIVRGEKQCRGDIWPKRIRNTRDSVISIVSLFFARNVRLKSQNCDKCYRLSLSARPRHADPCSARNCPSGPKPSQRTRRTCTFLLETYRHCWKCSWIVYTYRIFSNFIPWGIIFRSTHIGKFRN